MFSFPNNFMFDESDNTLVLAASTGFQATAVPDYRRRRMTEFPGVW